MIGKETLKQLPRLKSDEEAARFLDSADLTEYDLSGFKPSRSFATVELAEDRVSAIAATAMDKRHEPLNNLLDPE